MISRHDAKKITLALLLACAALGWLACQETEAAPVARADAVDLSAQAPRPGAAPRNVAQGAEPQDQSFLGALLFDRSPIEIEVPAGTALSLRLLQPISNHATLRGQGFQAELAEDVIVNREIAIPSGARVTGTVREIENPRRDDGPARLALSFDAVELPSGGAAPLDAVHEHVGEGESVLAAGTVVEVALDRPTTVEVPKEV
jgi:hypothetical protein